MPEVGELEARLERLLKIRPDLAEAAKRVVELGGELIHPGERWAICRDSEGSPFGLAQRRSD